MQLDPHQPGLFVGVGVFFALLGGVLLYSNLFGWERPEPRTWVALIATSGGITLVGIASVILGVWGLLA